jgi:ankyrin repeat protein/L-ascorbate metabolism protein UlaG (beta-lactamase superfamily)
MKTTLKILMAFTLLVFCSTLNAQNFFQAIRDGQYEKVEQLINENPGWIDSTSNGYSPLIFASNFGKEKIVELLLKHGADMYKVNPNNGITSLHFASIHNDLPVVEVLISYDMDVNVKDVNKKTALIDAIEKNNKKIVELLLKNNAKLPEEKEIMNQVLHSAILYGYQDIAEKLIKNGASLSSIDKNGRSLLHDAVIGYNLKWIDLLIAKPLGINQLDSFNRTPLHYSVEQGQLDITKLIVKEGAEINCIDCTNRKPLNIAQDLGHVQIADFLKSKGGTLSDSKIFKIAGEGNKKSEIKVTYIANMGVLISSASKNILIDALFNEGYDSYPITPKNIVSKINKFEPPFNSIDLILITHSDGDHFSAPMIAEYLSINKTVKVVCSNITSSALKKCAGYKVDTSRVIGITPELCKSMDTMVNDIKIKILRLRHNGSEGQEENIGFLINTEGVNVFHSGDSDGYVKQGLAVSGIQEYDSIGIEKMNIDLAILGKFYLVDSSSPGLQIIENYIKPKHIILSHFSNNNKESEWEPVDKTIKKNKDMLPEITLFKWQMQNIIIQKGL